MASHVGQAGMQLPVKKEVHDQKNCRLHKDLLNCCLRIQRLKKDR